MATSSPAFSLLLLLPYSSPSSKTLIPSSAPQILTRASSFSAATAASPHSLPLAFKFKSLSLFCSGRSLGPALVPHVATVPSDLEMEDEEEFLTGSEVEEEEDEEAPRLSPDLKLFVGNLPFNVDSAEIADLFSRAGTVEMVEVIFDKLTGKSRGFGFVTMSSVEEVDDAAQMFNGYELHGRQLRVNSGPPPPRDGPPPRRFRDGGNFDSFRSRDKFDSSRGRDNYDSSRSRGDFDSFQSRDNYDSSRSRGNFDSSRSRGNYDSSRSRDNFDSANRIHVGNLSWNVNDRALQAFFGEIGRVLDAKVICDRESGRSKGFGFVRLSSAAEVDRAISSLDGAQLEGRPVRVTVAEARSRPRF